MSQHEHHDLIDEAWVISLPKRRDRLATFLENYGRTRYPFPLSLEVMPANDGWDCDELPDLWSSRGAYGCWASHLAVLEGALNRGSQSVMVFEDDAVVQPDFHEQLADLMDKVPNWEALSLGGEHLRRPVPIYGALRCRMVARTHAYVVRGAALHQLVDVLRRFHGAYPHDWEQSMTLMWYRWYAPEHWLVGQAAGLSDITGKNEPYRDWNG